tara:strand:- start:2366 stop:2575 length:210 start_codon:yes stop_codon:yes gene_type:complete
MSKFEIRNNDDGTLDEVIAENSFFHLEQMDNGHWWIGINYVDDDGQKHMAHINLYTPNAKIKATIEIDI